MAQKILLVDKNQAFLKSFQDDLLCQSYPLLTADSARKAQLLISEHKEDLVSVFVSADISADQGPDVYSVIRFAKTIKPTALVYVFHDGKATQFTPELRKLGASGVLDKNVNYKMLVSISGLNAVHFDPKKAMEEAKKNTETLDTVTSANDGDFFPIRATDFISGSTVLFELYVKIREGRYVKILRAGDSFSMDRLNNYIAKGVAYFYMRNEMRHHYLEYSSKLSAAAASSSKLSAPAKASQVLNYGEETLKFLHEMGISKQHLQYASTFVNDVQKSIKALAVVESDALKAFMGNLASYEHGVSVTMIAGLIARQMKLDSEPSIQIVGIAGLLHDIGLAQLPERFHTEDTKGMSPMDFQEFVKHAEIGAEILGKIQGIHPSVLQAVSQHHDRKGKSLGTRKKLLNRISEIVGISDEFVHVIKKSAADPDHKVDPLVAMKEEFPGFSPAVVSAFREAFRIDEKK